MVAYQGAHLMWQLFLKPILDIGAGWIKGKQERQKAKLETDLAIEKAKVHSAINMAETGQQADINWELIHARASATSWKDEYWTIVLSIPAILCFVSVGIDGSAVVTDGFKALASTPPWYQGLLTMAVGASFGVRVAKRAKLALGKEK